MAIPQQQGEDNTPLKMTETEYLAFEEQSDIKHEFTRGKVYAMSGGSVRHGLITVNISTDLNIQLEDKDCRVSSPDVRIKVEAMESYRYPDVTVYCGEEDYVDGRTDVLGNPIVIVEVLSPSTALKDRNEKLDEYIEITTLQEYLLVSQHTAKVEVFSRNDANEWLYKQYKGMDATLTLSSIRCTLELARIYRKVTLDTEY